MGSLSMMSGELPGWFRAFLMIHVAGGLVALATFVIPIASAKGGKRHVGFGKVYLYGMGAVVVTALFLNPWRIFADPARTVETQSFAVFLLFIAMLAFAAMAFAIHAIELKKRTTPDPRLKNTAWSGLLIVLSLGTIYFGYATSTPLLTYFPIIGLVTGSQQLHYFLTAPRGKMHWWYAHMAGMMTACISTVTAFVVTALPRLIPNMPQQSLLLWLAPSLALVPVFKLLEYRYRRKFGS